MRKTVLSLAALLVLSLSACGGQPDGSAQLPPSPPAESRQAAPAPEYSFDGTVFRYDGKDYDIAEKTGAVNSIMDCTPVGKHIVIKGHVNPKNSVYCIFNTETEDFEPDIVGANLIWRGDEMTTAVYSFWNEVCGYGGNVLASLDLAEREHICELEFTKDNAALLVTVRCADGESIRTETVGL